MNCVENARLMMIVAAELIGAALLSVMLFPTIAGGLLSRTAAPVRIGHPAA